MDTLIFPEFKMADQTVSYVEQPEHQQHQRNQQIENQQTCQQYSQVKVGKFTLNKKELLGQGNFSKVYRGYDSLNTKFQVAIKVIDKKTLTQDLKLLVESQIQILRLINHPNIVRCHQIFEDEQNIYIIMELCLEGDLQTRIDRHGPVSEAEAIPIIKGVFKGLLYLSELKIIHRDIKVANIFMNQNTPKIADFGFSIHSKSKKQFQDISIGSPIYMSPEGIKHNVYGPTTDVWAFGIFIYELLHGKTPYSHCTKQKQLKYNISNQIGWYNLRPDITYTMKEVIYKCLEINYEKRITFQKLKELDFFSVFNTKKQIILEISPNKKIHFQTPKFIKQQFKVATPSFNKISQPNNNNKQKFMQKLSLFDQVRQKSKSKSKSKQVPIGRNQIQSLARRDYLNFPNDFSPKKNHRNGHTINSNKNCQKDLYNATYTYSQKQYMQSNQENSKNVSGQLYNGGKNIKRLMLTQVSQQKNNTFPYFKVNNKCRTQAQQQNQEYFSIQRNNNQFNLFINTNGDESISLKYGYKDVRNRYLSPNREYDRSAKFQQKGRQQRNQVTHQMTSNNCRTILNFISPQEDINSFLYLLHFSRLLYKLSCSLQGKNNLYQIKTSISLFCIDILEEVSKKTELNIVKNRYYQETFMQKFIQIHQTVSKYLHRYKTQFKINHLIKLADIHSLNSRLQKQMNHILSTEIKSKQAQSQNVRLLYLSWIYLHHFNQIFSKYFFAQNYKHWFQYNLTFPIKDLQNAIQLSNTMMSLQTYLKIKRKQQQRQF